MKKAFIVTLLGLCIHGSGAYAADSTAAIKENTQDTAKRVETNVCVQEEANKYPGSTMEGEGGIYFGGGIYYQQLEKFNDVVSKHGFNKLDNTMNSFSCGFFGVAKPRHRFGLDFEYFWSDPASAIADSSTFSSVKAHGFSLGLKGGYDLISHPKWGVMPIYGIGYYSHTYEFKPRSNNFEDILNGNSPKEIQFSYSGVSLTAGLNVHINWKLDKPKKIKGFLHEPKGGLNLEGGIHYYPLRNLSADHASIDNGPKMSRFGLYTKLYLDLGEKATPLRPIETKTN
jgi:hypothetical protein